MKTPKLSLGPVLYYWSREDLFAFYDQVAGWPLDSVSLGEVVCSKRRSLRFEEWLEIAERLRQAGKEVVLSTLALIEAESELKTLKRICDNQDFLIEANDMAAVHRLAKQGQPFVAGPGLNIYNARTLALLARKGLRRWVFPLELARDSLAEIQAERPAGVETEVFAYGRLPLTLSARCFTARAHNLPKDDCQFRCLDYPEGMLLSTREHQPFLIINGIQTLSGKTCNLIPQLADLRRLGVDHLRISPQARNTGQVVELIARQLSGEGATPQDRLALEKLAPGGVCDGYWFGGAGMAKLGELPTSR